MSCTSRSRTRLRSRNPRPLRKAPRATPRKPRGNGSGCPRVRPREHELLRAADFGPPPIPARPGRRRSDRHDPQRHLHLWPTDSSVPPTTTGVSTRHAAAASSPTSGAMSSTSPAGMSATSSPSPRTGRARCNAAAGRRPLFTRADSCVGALTFSEGAHATFEVSVLSHVGAGRQRNTVHLQGDGGRLELTHTFAGPLARRLGRPRRLRRDRVARRLRAPWRRRVHRRDSRRRSVRPDFVDGWRVQQIVAAAETAAHTGTWIDSRGRETDMKVASISFWHLHGTDYARDALQNPELDLVALWDDDRERGMAGAALTASTSSRTST